MTNRDSQKLSAGGLLVALGIIFGDIGTSPLYVFRAVLSNTTYAESMVFGVLSCIFWTLTFITTIKYVLLILRADNNGEGGIFSLFALVRKEAKWFVIPAVIGGSALFADGIITPPISVSSAVEGLRLISPDIKTIPIVILILICLFYFQHFGTRIVGRSFGPVMLVWFSMLALLGFSQITANPQVLKALNPYYAFQFLFDFPGGLWLLGSIFLCTTGAEALYSDLGHCGRANIQISWCFVKTALVLNYFGQGAWLLSNSARDLSNSNPFFELMPYWFLPIGIMVATVATIIASQAVISGSFTIAAEAMRLSLLPKTRVLYPTDLKGQIYVPFVNLLLLIGCVSVVLIFKESANMEAAYGLAISITMLMATLLFAAYLKTKNTPRFLVFSFLVIYLVIELTFLTANLAKFIEGGWLTLVIGILVAAIMFIWSKGTQTKLSFVEYDRLSFHLAAIEALGSDEQVPKYATHLAYMTGSPLPTLIEKKIIYSLLYSNPKRADVYWFVHVNVLNVPHASEYEVTTLVPQKIFRVDFKLGFRVEPKVNLLFKRVLDDLAENKEVDPFSRYKSLKEAKILGDIRFVVIHRELSYESNLSAFQKLVMSGYFMLKRISFSEEKSFGLDTCLVTKETVPLVLYPITNVSLTRSNAN
ncbi:MAG TPA: KUP/HAK/KT family potassium transporter [Oligoflexia bacterium]|nr:KUP/HAK/KT family potassium transporter [Oligoflexia bacterium]HMP26586.1 KUP/HAK/KT family potassium transporter [Oligoflexia bacterium]